ncbi:hypothetical protein [Halobellus clavatus]|uniref:hypothetical protein n=1 Tax=Halobellus clavatus TaxID=660517 RepID=UPI001113FAE4|nr:hypothetical protein [Halobellus clavatus]
MVVVFPLQLGLVLAGLILIILFISISSIITGLIVSIVTLPFLYITGYGFLPLQWTPAYGMALRKSMVRHIIFGTIVFGLATAVGIIWPAVRSEGFSLGIGIVGVELVGAVIVLTIAVTCSVVASAKGGVLTRERAAQQILPLIGAWFGYPIILYGLLVLVGMIAGGGSTL